MTTNMGFLYFCLVYFVIFLFSTVVVYYITTLQKLEQKTLEKKLKKDSKLIKRGLKKLNPKVRSKLFKVYQQQKVKEATKRLKIIEKRKRHYKVKGDL